MNMNDIVKLCIGNMNDDSNSIELIFIIFRNVSPY